VFDAITGAFAYMDSSTYWITFLIAMGIATAVGLIPGVGSTAMMAVVLPIVLLGVDDPAVGIVMLAVITGTANTFDSIPAQLMGIVSSGTQVTFLEGHQLTRKGLGAYSLGATYAVSAIGGLVGAGCLLLVIPFLRPFILQIGFAEIAVLGLFGVGMVGVLSKGAMAKGLTSGMLGLFLGTVGFQSYTAVDRFTFGNWDLREGLPLVAFIAGMMAVPEMLDLAVSRKPVAPAGADVSSREVFRGFRYGLSRWRIAIRHSVLGVGLGAIPGAGGNVVTWISYGIGIALSKDKSQFGKGSVDGLIFAESSENSKEGGQAIPTLALGVPGSVSWALVLVALLSYGVTPGPDVLTEHSDIVGLIVVSFALANLLLTILALLVTRQLMRLTAIPYATIVGPILPIVVLGAFFVTPTMVILPVIAIFAVVGLVMKQYGWPRPPLVLGFILAPTIENNLYSGIGVYGVHGMITRPLTIALFFIAVALTAYLQWSMRKTREPIMEVVAESDDSPLPPGTTLPDPLHDAPPSNEMVVETAPGSSDLQTLAPVREKKKLLYWRPENVVPVTLIVLGIYAFQEILSWEREAARYLPIAMVGGILILCTVQLISDLLKPVSKRAAVLDLDLRSAGIEGSRRAALITAGLLLLYYLAIEAIGIRDAGLVFAALTPILLMKTRSRWIAALISVILYYGFVVIFGDRLLAIYWPTGWFM
jgi:putative tricarboxylic transport membrane protein